MTARNVSIRNQAWFQNEKLCAVIDRAYRELLGPLFAGFGDADGFQCTAHLWNILLGYSGFCHEFPEK